MSLLISDLVSHAVQRDHPGADTSIRLRAWALKDVVRVELWAPSALLEPQEDSAGPCYEQLLLDQLADRWSTDNRDATACTWFEIDRQ